MNETTTTTNHHHYHLWYTRYYSSSTTLTAVDVHAPPRGKPDNNTEQRLCNTAVAAERPRAGGAQELWIRVRTYTKIYIPVFCTKSTDKYHKSSSVLPSPHHQSRATRNTHLDDRVAAVVEQLPEGARAVGPPGLLAVYGIQSLVDEEGQGEQSRAPTGHLSVQLGAVARQKDGRERRADEADEGHEVRGHPQGEKGHGPVPEGREQVVYVGVGARLVLVSCDHLEILIGENRAPAAAYAVMSNIIAPAAALAFLAHGCFLGDVLL